MDCGDSQWPNDLNCGFCQNALVGTVSILSSMPQFRGRSYPAMIAHVLLLASLAWYRGQAHPVVVACGPLFDLLLAALVACVRLSIKLIPCSSNIALTHVASLWSSLSTLLSIFISKSFQNLTRTIPHLKLHKCKCN